MRPHCHFVQLQQIEMCEVWDSPIRGHVQCCLPAEIYRRFGRIIRRLFKVKILSLHIDLKRLNKVTDISFCPRVIPVEIAILLLHVNRIPCNHGMARLRFDYGEHGLYTIFFIRDPIYLQSVIIHSANGGKGEGWHVEEYSVALLC
jgi:hypothetical protein